MGSKGKVRLPHEEGAGESVRLPKGHPALPSAQAMNIIVITDAWMK